jgi:hypothetical protein
MSSSEVDPSICTYGFEEKHFLTRHVRHYDRGLQRTDAPARSFRPGEAIQLHPDVFPTQLQADALAAEISRDQHRRGRPIERIEHSAWFGLAGVA